LDGAVKVRALLRSVDMAISLPYRAPDRGKSERKTQEERREQSRSRLLEAAVQCLVEDGYHGTTLTAISRRARLSLGCLQHHFPSREELLIAAVRWLFERRRAEFLEAFSRLPDTDDRVARAIDLLWQVINGDSFLAYLELVVAARTDARLRRALTPLADQLGREVKQTFLLHMGSTPATQGFEEAMPTWVFAVLEGLALGRIASPRSLDADAVLAAMKATSGLLVHPISKVR